MFTIEMEESRLALNEDGKTVCWLSESIADNTAMVCLGGRLRADTVHVFLDEVNALVSVGMSLMIDMHEVSYLSNAYLNAMLTVQRSADARKQTMVLCSLSPEARSALDSAHAACLFDIR